MGIQFHVNKGFLYYYYILYVVYVTRCAEKGNNTNFQMCTVQNCTTNFTCTEKKMSYRYKHKINRWQLPVTVFTVAVAYRFSCYNRTQQRVQRFINTNRLLKDRLRSTTFFLTKTTEAKQLLELQCHIIQISNYSTSYKKWKRDRIKTVNVMGEFCLSCMLRKL